MSPCVSSRRVRVPFVNGTVEPTQPYLVKRIPEILRRGSMRMIQDSNFAFGHRIKAFQRFEFFPEMLLFAQVKGTPGMAMIDALKHFVHRFQTFVTGLYNDGFLWVATQRKGFELPLRMEFDSKQEALDWLRKECREKIRERLDFSVEWNEKFYETFFDSLFIEQRRNPKLQKQLMPLFFLDKGSPEYRSMRLYKRPIPNTTLKEFE